MARKKKPVYLFILALVLLYVVIYGIPQLMELLERTEVLKPGTIQVTETTVCCFVRTEEVYTAADRGKLHYLVKEGAHVRKGTKVLKLNPKAPPHPDKKEESKYTKIIDRLGEDTIPGGGYKAKSSGILSYYVDGYENYFKPKIIKTLKYKEVLALRARPVALERNVALKKEPFFKICDNDRWYLVCWMEAGSAACYEPGSSVTIQLPDGEVKAQVEEINRTEERWQVIFRSNRYYESFAKSRTAKGDIISEEYSGLIVKNSSITTKDGKAGLMVKQKDENYIFVPVEIIGRDGEHSALREGYFIDKDGISCKTVNVYDEVLKHPETQ